MDEYKRTLDDEIDWKIIDQLQTATNNFSNSSLELKKIYFVLISIAVPTLLKITDDKIDLSLFITIYILSTAFLIMDSFTYYYQESLREKMNSRFTSIKKRNDNLLSTDRYREDSFTIEISRTKEKRIIRSFFNMSVSFYYVLIILNTIGLIYFIYCM